MLQGKWYVVYSELKLSEKPFAEGKSSYVYDCQWRGLDVAAKWYLLNILIYILNLYIIVVAFNHLLAYLLVMCFQCERYSCGFSERLCSRN